MIAVTIGTGRYQQLAKYAAQAVREKTGLDTIILSDEHFAASGFPTPHFLKLRLFDLTNADSILFFDADILCLNRWCPQSFASEDAVVGVADRAVFKEVCREWGIPIGEYINTGLMILNRHLHHEWFCETERFVRSKPPMDFWEQSPLNIVRHNMGLKLNLIDRRYNWLDVGAGSLSLKLPIYMAHKIIGPAGMANLEYFEGRHDPNFKGGIELDEVATDGLKGQILRFKNGLKDTSFYLNADGTLGPPESPVNGSYWFVRNDSGMPVLVISSETEILQEFSKCPDGRWEALQRLEFENESVSAMAEKLIKNRWFGFKICGRESRMIELLEGGRVGLGASELEQFWYTEAATDGIQLILGAGHRETCRITLDACGRYGEGRQLLQGNARARIVSAY